MTMLVPVPAMDLGGEDSSMEVERDFLRVRVMSCVCHYIGFHQM